MTARLSRKTHATVPTFKGCSLKNKAKHNKMASKSLNYEKPNLFPQFTNHREKNKKK